MTRLRYNGLRAVLGGAGLTTSATSVTFAAKLTHANGTDVPTITGTDYIPLTILDATNSLSEIVWLTAYTAAATTGTIVRGRESTTGVAHLAGDKVIHGATALDDTLSGGTNVSITDNSGSPKVSVTQTFRGEWATDQLLFTDTLQATPSSTYWTPSGTATTAGSGGPNGTYPAYARTGDVQFTNTNGSWVLNTALVPALAGKSLTRAVFYTRTYKYSGSTPVTLKENATTRYTSGDPGNTTTSAWAQVTATLATTNPTLTFGPAGGSTMEMHFTGLQVYGTADPYMTGQCVMYSGLLYRSVIDNNASVPGADANWVVVPITGAYTAESARDDVGAALRGGTNVSVVLDDPNDTITVKVAQNFRGAWASDTLVYTDALSSGTLPSYMAIDTTTWSVYSTTGGPGAPNSGYVQVSDNFSRNVTLTITTASVPALAGKTLSRVVFWHQESKFNGATAPVLKENGTLRYTFPDPGSGNTNAWSQSQAVLASANPVITVYDATYGTKLSGLQFYAASDPYMIGQVVSYGGRLWTSVIDNNASVPGADTNWTSIVVPVFQGDWSATPTYPYMTGQFVMYSGVLYKSAIDTNTSTPGADANWTVSGAGGATGAPGGGGPAVPSWAGTRTRFYNQNTAIYNYKKSNTRRWNKALGLAMAGTGSAKIAVIGDSISAYRIGAATNDHQHMWPLIGRDTIQQLTPGVGFGGDGFVCAGHAGPILDSRWVINSGGSVTQDFIQLTTTGGNATFTSAKAGTVIDIVTFSSSPAMTYSIDGAAAVTITPSGTNVPQKTTITGLANTTHTVTLTRTGASTAYILGVSCTQAISGVVVHNIAQYGSTTANTGTGWTSTGTFQMVNYRENALKTLLPIPDLLIVNLGINDANGGATAATVSANLTTIFGRWTCDKMIVVPPQPSTASGITLATWNTYASMYYDLADSMDIPLLDMYDIQGGFIVANGNGVQTDNFHPEVMFQRDAGRAFGMALIG